ncbi:MAG: Dabb family protein [Candidatus Sericytochromatia bacterium]|nr:Dabb family protein [Candidatus Sericytochromatia bacterium]
MLKHMVFFRLDGLAEEQEAAMIEAFEGLVSVIPELLSLRIGRNISTRDDQFTHGLFSEHPDMAACMAYVNHPAHQAAIAQHLAPYMKHRAIVDFECP